MKYNYYFNNNYWFSCDRVLFAFTLLRPEKVLTIKALIFPKIVEKIHMKMRKTM